MSNSTLNVNAFNKIRRHGIVPNLKEDEIRVVEVENIVVGNLPKTKVTRRFKVSMMNNCKETKTNTKINNLESI